MPHIFWLRGDIMKKMTKQIIGFTALGIGTYLIYKNMDKLKEMAGNMAELMKDETCKLEDMI